MKAVGSMAAVFCLGCLCAELVSRLVGPGWAGRCIKAVAGLYILVVLFRLLPGKLPEPPGRGMSAASPVDLGSAEQMILSETETQLETRLAEECRSRFGIPVTVDVTLKEGEGTVSAAAVLVYIPAECPEAVRRELAEYLQNTLAVQPELREGGPDE